MWTPLAMLVVLTTTLALWCALVTQCEAQEPFECGDRETLILSPWMYEPMGRSCQLLISEYPNVKHVGLRAECQRWYGSARLPATMASYRVTHCSQHRNGTTQYRAEICCADEMTLLRCFTCVNSKNDYECAYHNDPQTCADSQVCQTTVSFHNMYPFTKRRKANACTDRATCESLSSLNSRTCRGWNPNPSCVYCCDQPFCNLKTPSPMYHVAENECASSPCSNGGTCVLDALREQGYRCTCPRGYNGTWCELNLNIDSPFSGRATRYPCDNRPCQNQAMCVNQGTSFRCLCKQGYTGIDCSIEHPECGPQQAGYCLNGGTCLDHTIYGIRCRCASGFVGSRCELPMLTCKYPASTWMSAYKMFIHFGDVTCTERVQQENARNLHDAYKLRQCHERMAPGYREPFRDNMDGEVVKLEGRSLWMCEKGEQYAEYSEIVCCPSCYSLPCLNGGWCIQLDDGDYMCKCRFGWEGKNCETKPGLCVISGDPHFVSFDGTVINTQGVCMYEASTVIEGRVAEWRYFRLLVRAIRQADSNTRISYPHTVVLSMRDDEIILTNDVVQVNGEEVVLEYNKRNIKIFYNGRFIRVETPQGVVVEFDTRFTVILKLPDPYKRKVKGICGNMDGDPDYPEKFNKRGQYMFFKPANIAKSWHVPFPNAPKKCLRTKKKRQAGDPDDALLDEDDVDDDGDEDDFVPTCDAASMALIATRAYCGLIRDAQDVFKDCILDPQSAALREYENCYYDACANADLGDTMKRVACQSVEVFAVTCHALGYIVTWRHRADCQPECPAGMEYRAMTVACRPTCRNPNADRECTLPDRENCVCPAGLIFHDTQCIDPALCGCMDPFGQKHEIGDQWTTENCSKSYRCAECTSCAYPVGTLQEVDTSCQPYEECLYDPGTQMGTCVLNVICPEGMYFSTLTSACPATCEDPGAPLTCSQGLGVGCACPPGLVLQDNVCMDPSECKCLHQSDSEAEIGATWLSVDCRTQYSCLPCTNCTLSVAVIHQMEYQCQPNQICVPISETHGECMEVPECPFGMEYRPGAPSCLPTCEDPGAQTSCHQTVRQGCVCEPGLVYRDNQCVQPSACGCVGQQGGLVQVGAVWLSADCSMEYTCVECQTCPLPVGEVISAEHQCADDETCMQANNNTGSCQRVECPEGLLYVSNTSPCPPTCEDPAGTGPCWESILDNCRCPGGMVHDNGMCMDPAECGCDTSYGEHVQVGTSWLSANCELLNTCEPCAACPLPVGAVATSPTQCPEAHKCVSDGAQRGICVPDCPDGMTYEQITNQCPAKCDNPDSEISCPEDMGPGCACPEGMVRRGDTCIDPEMCTCLDTEGNAVEVGSAWLLDDCTRQYKCEPCLECAFPVGVFKQDAHQCDDQEMCVQFEQNKGRCIVVPDCPLGMVYSLEAPPCQPTCQDPAAGRDCPLPPAPGCTCPGDMVLNGGQCTKPDECPCTDNTGVTHVAGSTWLSLDCNLVYQCFPCVDCPFPVSTLTTDNFLCDNDEICVHDGNVALCKLVPECPDGQEYSLTASACPATCTNPNAPQNCPSAVFEGCTCPDDQVVSRGTCVLPEECPCPDARGFTHQIGEFWLSDDCAEEYRCVACTECALPVGRVQGTAHECGDGFGCALEAGVALCRAVPGCPDGQLYSFSVQRCPATCADPDAPMRCLGQTIGVEGCECEEGLLLNDLGDCVTPDNCGCPVANGAELKIGASWLSNGCRSLRSCVPCNECSRPVGRIMQTPYTCGGDSVCVAEGADTWSCRQQAGCPEGQVYSVLAPGCPATCEDPDAPDLCLLPPVEGCMCQRGTVLDPGGVCVPPEDCDCLYDNDLTFKIGTSWLSMDCTVQYQCVPCMTCRLPVGRVVQGPYICGDGYMCVLYDTRLGVCQRIPDCPVNQTYTLTAPACPPTCADPEAEATCPLPPGPGCSCPLGQVRDGDQCADPGNCHCTQDNVVYPIGSVWLSPDCGTEYSCVACADCAYPVAKVEEAAFVCGDDSLCLLSEQGVITCDLIPECPEDQVYSLITTGCPVTCEDPGAPGTCLLPTVAGCGCLDGLVLWNNTCIPPGECLCSEENGVFYQVGSTWLAPDCVYEYSCVECADCALPVARVTETEFLCGEGSLCTVDVTDAWACIETMPCPVGMTYSLVVSACPANCADPGAPITCELPPAPGCTCYTGLVLLGDQCVQPETCQCQDPDGNIMDVGFSWVSPDCTVSYACVTCMECALPVAKLVNQTVTCDVNQLCLTDGDILIGHCVQACPADMIYEFRATGCPATCQDPDAPDRCTLETRGSCVCPEGMILNEVNECTTPAGCQCIDYLGRKFKIGTAWLGAGCTVQYRCVACTLCSMPVAQLERDTHVCEAGTFCTLVENGLGICTIAPDCPRGMVYQLTGTACPATCADPDAPDKCLLPPVEGCTCARGLVLQQGVCMDPTQCECVDAFGNIFQPGTSWLSSDCGREYRCVRCDTCTLTINVVFSRAHSCEVGNICFREPNRQLGSCVLAPACPGGMTYSAVATGCQATCADPDAPQNCRLPNIEGCTCVAGYVQRGTTCVHPGQCPCVDDFGNAFLIGTTWLSKDCMTQYQCVSCETCALPVGVMVVRQHGCVENEICSFDNTMVGFCSQGPECPPGFEYSAQGTTCPATCEDPDAPLRCPSPPTPGCLCPGNMVLDTRGRCVYPNQCSCIGVNGRNFQIGQTWLSVDCRVQYSCVTCDQCTLPVARLVQREHQCTTQEQCQGSDNGLEGWCTTLAECPPTMVSTALTSRCMVTCTNPEPPVQCTLGRCTCPEGTLLDGDICVPPDQCTCTDNFGQRFQVGSAWRSPDCTVLYTCVTCFTCVLPVAVVQSQLTSCDTGQICDTFDIHYGTCMEEGVQCPPGLVYSPSAPACPATCTDPAAPARCPPDNTAGCTCPPGTVLMDGTACVPPSACGCLDFNGRQFQYGEQWLSTDCTILYTCGICETCSVGVTVVTETPFSCPVTEICRLDSNNHGRCIQRDPDETFIYLNQFQFLVMTLNGAVVQSGDIVVLTKGLPYTFTISDSTNVIYATISLRKVVDGAVRMENMCTQTATCSDQYAFDETDRLAQETRLEARVGNGRAERDLHVLCQVQEQSPALLIGISSNCPSITQPVEGLNIIILHFVTIYTLL